MHSTLRMHLHGLKFLVLSLLCLPVLAGCGASLASDIIPPPDAQVEVTAEPAGAQNIFPLVLPDPQAGEVVYRADCAACHGEKGLGNGPKAGNLPRPVPAIGTAALERTARPVDWFQVVTEGRLDRSMPGFGDSLSDRQRWDVTAYVLTMAGTPEEMTYGKAIYSRLCQSCHGEKGRGSGPSAPPGTPDWSDPEPLIQQSLDAILQTISAGKAPGMPAYAGELDAAGLQATAGYVRALSFATGQAAPAAEAAGQPGERPPESALAVSATLPANANFTGRVVNGSGSPLPEGLTVRLQGFDGMQPALELDAPVGSDGTFAFLQVPMTRGRVFLGQVEYNGGTFNSSAVHASDVTPGKPVDLTVEVFDRSSDITPLVAERMHLIFDFTQPEQVQIIEMFLISNSGKHMIAPPQPGQPLLHFSLPVGADNLQFQDGALGDRFVQTEDGFADTRSILPGESQYQVLFTYDLPYKGVLALSMGVPVPVRAAVVMVPASGVAVESKALQDVGIRPIQGVNIHVFSANNLPANSLLELALSGFPEQAAASDPKNGANLAIGLTLFVAAVFVGLLWFFRMRRAPEPAGIEVEDDLPDDSPETLMDAILALDDQFQAGDMPEAAYKQRRANLKERLRRTEGR